MSPKGGFRAIPLSYLESFQSLVRDRPKRSRPPEPRDRRSGRTMPTIYADRSYYPFDGRYPPASLAVGGARPMRDILEYCIGGLRRSVSAGTEVLHEGGRT